MVFSPMSAGVMELVDVLDSKSCERTLVSVRVRPPAIKKEPASTAGFFLPICVLD